MKNMLPMILLILCCNSIGLNNPICGADNIDDILGVWYRTEGRPGPCQGCMITDTSVWYLDRIPIWRGSTSMDSLRITIEYHPGDATYDINKHAQTSVTLAYNPRQTSYGTLCYDNAKFSIPGCDSLIINWTNGKIIRLFRRV